MQRLDYDTDPVKTWPEIPRKPMQKTAIIIPSNCCGQAKLGATAAARRRRSRTHTLASASTGSGRSTGQVGMTALSHFSPFGLSVAPANSRDQFTLTDVRFWETQIKARVTGIGSSWPGQVSIRGGRGNSLRELHPSLPEGPAIPAGIAGSHWAAAR